MKKLIKHLLHGLACLACFVLVLALVSFIFQPKGNRAEDGMYDTNPNGILAEPADTVDVLILGDSEADCAFVPHKIWRDHGISVYICGIGGASPYQTFGLLRQAFRTQHPKIVLVEGNHLYSSFSVSTDMLYRMEEILPVFRFHNRWKNLKLQDFTKVPHFDSLEYQKGYHFDWRINPADTTHYMEYTEEISYVSDTVYNCVADMKHYCEERGAELIVVSVPSAMNWDYSRHNGIQAMSDALGLKYVDMNLLREEIPVDWETETQDFGDHVNFSGALKVSDYTAKMLKENADFCDKRGGIEQKNWDWVIGQFLEINELPGDALDGLDFPMG